MMKTDPITPPPELIGRIIDESETCAEMIQHAYAAGADMELEASCMWLEKDLDAYELVGLRAVYLDHNLRAARRPKTLTLKDQALYELNDIYNRDKIDDSTYDTIRRALEALDD